MWAPEEGQITEGQPLAELRKEEGKGLEWLADVQKMSVEELRELGRLVGEAKARGEAT